LQVFRTRELAAMHQMPGNTVVWMSVVQWWKKVLDAAKTGYPPNVDLLYGITDGHTDERVFFCQNMASCATGLLEFIDILQNKRPCDSKVVASPDKETNAPDPEQRKADEEFMRARDDL
jgi:hypothetical protein